jgi:glycerol-3-phosphate cytidylyltransferase-like family protein
MLFQKGEQPASVAKKQKARSANFCRWVGQVLEGNEKDQFKSIRSNLKTFIWPPCKVTG